MLLRGLEAHDGKLVHQQVVSAGVLLGWLGARDNELSH
jgi:hypothetical protein